MVLVHRPARGRRHRGRRERRARDGGGGPVAARSHAQVHGPDHRRARRHRAGAGRGVRADGVLRRLDRRDLPAVLHHAGVGHGAVGARGADPHAGAVRDAAQAAAAAAGHVERRGFFGWFNRGFDRSRAKHEQRPACACCARTGAHAMLVYVRDRRGDGSAVHAHSHLVPADEDPGIHLRPGADAAGRVQGAHLGSARQGAEVSAPSRRRTSSTACSRWPASTSPAPARTRACCSSSSRTGTSASKDSQIVTALAGRAPARTSPRIKEANDHRRAAAGRAGAGQRLGLRHACCRIAAASATTSFIAARNQLLGRGRRRIRAWPACGPTAWRTRRSSSSTSTARRRARWASPSPTSTRPCRPAWASTYVNDFIDRGRVKRVYVQGEPGSRMQPEDLNRWYVRNSQGGMVPFSAFGRGEWTYGPQKLRALQRRAVVPDPGRAGAGAQLGRSDGRSWRSSSRSCRAASASSGRAVVRGKAVRLAGAAAVCDFAGRGVPVPRGAVRELVDSDVGAAGRAAGRAGRGASPRSRAGLSNDAYFQVGLLTTIGLAAKSAILIVEFAKENFDRGAGPGRKPWCTPPGSACARSS